MNKFNFYLCILFSAVCTIFSQPLHASFFCGCGPLDLAAEVRVAYYHPSSSKVRRIYGDGWADYQFELSKGIGCGLRAWVGVSGFSRNGDSIGFHNRTNLQLIPVNFGLKYYYPLACNLNVFIGGAACYSFLRIHDHSDFVHKHTHKNDWGGLIQSGLSYQFCDWGIVTAFADYYFQRFHFHDSHGHSGSRHSGNRHSNSRHSNGDYYGNYYGDYYGDYYGSSYSSGSSQHSRFVERHSLDMSGYKIGVGLGVTY